MRSKDSSQARQLLRKLLAQRERLQFPPQEVDGKRSYTSSGRPVGDKVLAGALQIQKRWRPAPYRQLEPDDELAS